MTKIAVTQEQLNEVVAVRNAEGIFRLPINADLSLRRADDTFGTAYGTTDPDVDLSFVNVAYLNSHLNSVTLGEYSATSPYPAGSTVRLNSGDFNGGLAVALQELTAGTEDPNTLTQSSANWLLVYSDLLDAKQDTLSVALGDTGITWDADTATLDFSGLRIIFENLSAAPTSPEAGRAWFDTTDNEIKFFNGAMVKTLADLNDVAPKYNFANIQTTSTEGAATASTQVDSTARVTERLSAYRPSATQDTIDAAKMNVSAAQLGTGETTPSADTAFDSSQRVTDKVAVKYDFASIQTTTTEGNPTHETHVDSSLEVDRKIASQVASNTNAAILDTSGTPTLAAGITAAEVRALLDAQTSLTSNQLMVVNGVVFTQVEKTKLAGIATGADVTPSWVPQNNPGYLTDATQRFTAADEAKLDGIEDNADVTPSWVPDSNPNYLTESTQRFTTADEMKLDGIEEMADVTPSWVPETDPGYLLPEDERFTPADESKLDGIEANATNTANPAIESDTNGNINLGLNVTAAAVRTLLDVERTEDIDAPAIISDGGALSLNTGVGDGAIRTLIGAQGNLSQAQIDVINTPWLQPGSTGDLPDDKVNQNTAAYPHFNYSTHTTSVRVEIITDTGANISQVDSEDILNTPGYRYTTWSSVPRIAGPTIFTNQATAGGNRWISRNVYFTYDSDGNRVLHIALAQIDEDDNVITTNPVYPSVGDAMYFDAEQLEAVDELIVPASVGSFSEGVLTFSEGGGGGGTGNGFSLVDTLTADATVGTHERTNEDGRGYAKYTNAFVQVDGPSPTRIILSEAPQVAEVTDKSGVQITAIPTVFAGGGNIND